MGRFTLFNGSFPFAITLLIVFMVGCDQPQDKKEVAKDLLPEQGVIFAMGDSLTAGLGVSEAESYPVILERLLVKSGLHYRVINGGISGETSSGALSRIDWILKLNPDIVILETGANDGLRGIAPDLIRENIEQCIKNLLARDVDVVLVGMKMVANLGPDYLEAFNTIYPEIAAGYPVTYMPFFLKGVAAEPALNQADGIHPTGEGYRVIAGNLLPYVKEAIKNNQRRE